MKRWATATACMAVAGAVALFWTTRLAVSESGTPPYDLARYFYPLYAAVSASLAKGVVPLWNPYELSGLPVLAAPAAGVFYPPHLLYLLLPTHQALAASGLLHLVFAALCTLWLVRRTGHASLAGAALAGILFSLRGELPEALYLAPCRLEAAAWLPLGCIAVLDIATPPDPARNALRGLALLAVCVGASWLAGFPQTTIYITYAWGALLLALLVAQRAPLRRWLGASAMLGMGLALGTLVGAIQLLPALELTQIGTRTTEALGLQRMYPFGDPGSLILERALAGLRTSFSMVALALAPAALIWPGRRAVASWGLALAGLSFLFALGPSTPLFELYLALPTLGWFRAPYRVLILASFALAVVGGLGLSAFVEATTGAPARNGDGERQRRLRPATVAGPIAIASALAVIARWEGNPRAALVAGVLALLLLAGARWGRRLGARTVGSALLAFATVEVFWVPALDYALPYHAAFAARYESFAPALAQLGERTGHHRVWLLNPKVMPLGVSQKLAPLYGIRAFTGRVGLSAARQSSYYRFLARGSTSEPSRELFLGDLQLNHLPTEPPALATRWRLVDLAAVRYVAVPWLASGDPAVRNLVRDAGLVRVSGGKPLVVYENPRALPRAFAVYRTRPAPAEPERLQRLSRESFDPLTASFVEGDPGFVAGPSSPERGHAVSFTRDERHVVELEAELAAPGLVVLADTHYPGWRASVDGEPARILATNHLFRGVPVPAGLHIVRFEYRPTSVIAGGSASIAGLVVLAVLVGLWSREGARAKLT